ncbi:hypothetical protein BJV74DRAFT_802522 [Russula compacta]|nr:hypothetical protein BJV74DRAFT_802522 [Russula compacta]
MWLRTATRTAFSPKQLRCFGRTVVPRNIRPTDAPPKQATSSEPPPYLNIKLPDLSAPPPEPELHIPFTPDFWESSRVKAEAAPALPEEPQIPKVIIVAGDTARADSTHISHTHEPIREHVTPEQHHHYAEPSSGPKVSNLRSLFLDVADDLMLPKDLSALKPHKGRVPHSDDLIEEALPSTGGTKFHTRMFDKEELGGVWILLGLFAGSWLAGGLLKKDSKYAEPEEQSRASA